MTQKAAVSRNTGLEDAETVTGARGTAAVPPERPYPGGPATALAAQSSPARRQNRDRGDQLT